MVECLGLASIANMIIGKETIEERKPLDIALNKHMIIWIKVKKVLQKLWNKCLSRIWGAIIERTHRRHS